LIDAFQLILQEKVPAENLSEILKEFTDIIKKSSNKIFVPADTQFEFDELNTKFGKAISMITFTARPIETFNNAKSRVFLDKLLENIKFTHEEWHLPVSKLNTVYEYYISEEGMAFMFYQTLYNRILFLLNDINREEIQKRFTELNNKYLKVYFVDKIFCTFRQIVFDHDTLTPAGFIVFTHGQNFSVSKMSSSGIQRWMMDIYNPCLLHRQEMRFSKFAERLHTSATFQEYN